MIVICTRCQSRFRVADEKIGPRGAKVRCSKCQTVFAVHRDLGTLPADAPDRPAARPAEVDLERRPAPRPAAPPPPPAPPPAPAQDDPFAQDPFQARAGDPFAQADRAAELAAPPPPVPPAAPPEPDPFGAPAFAAAPAAPPPPEQAADDPFAAPAALLAQAADPFAASVTPRSASGGSALPVTDLSDLLGEPTPASLRGPRAAPRPAPPPIPPPAPDPAFGTDSEDGLGLSLEERLTPPPMPAVPAFSEPEPPPPPVGFQAGAFGGASDPAAFEPSALDGGDAGELALATEPTPPGPLLPPPPSPPRASARPQPRAAAPAPAPPPPPEPAEVPAEGQAPDRIPGGRAARVRSLAVNAAALAALLLVAFALLAAWRSGGRLELASLRPSAVLAGLRGAAAEPFAAEGVSSGLYERDAAPPLLFVRGQASSRGPAPVPGLRVRVELVRGGAVIARGEALAGAVPGAEELHGARDAEALAAVARAAEARAPREVRPGEALPFLVAISDHPAELAGASLRVSVEAAGPP